MFCFDTPHGQNVTLHRKIEKSCIFVGVKHFLSINPCMHSALFWTLSSFNIIPKYTALDKHCGTKPQVANVVVSCFKGLARNVVTDCFLQVKTYIDNYGIKRF